jgi:hypothetical protein
MLLWFKVDGVFQNSDAPLSKQVRTLPQYLILKIVRVPVLRHSHDNTPAKRLNKALSPGVKSLASIVKKREQAWLPVSVAGEIHG